MLTDRTPVLLNLCDSDESARVELILGAGYIKRAGAPAKDAPALPVLYGKTNILPTRLSTALAMAEAAYVEAKRRRNL